MSTDTRPDRSNASEIFKALGDPIRLDIVRQVADAGELAWGALEDTLPVSKPTISYHIKTLVQANLLSVRKEGRNFYYTIRHDTLNELLDEIWTLSPQPRVVRGDQVDHSSAPRTRRRSGAARHRSSAHADVATNDDGGAVILTW
jgi:DNA-binding transcriptional ArsR family regulator